MKLTEMMNRQMLALLLAIILLAGCMAPGEEDETGAQEPPGPEPFQRPFTLSACTETILMFMVDPEKAQESLPSGFQAADAQLWLGTPAPTGSSMVVVTVFECESASHAEGAYAESHLSITIEPPVVEHGQEEAINMYIVKAATPTPDVQALYEELGWSSHGSEVAATASFGLLVEGTGRVSDSDGVVVSFEAVGTPVTLPIEGTYRWWHASEVGLGFVDYEIDVETHVTLAECSLRPGSIITEVSGETECTPLNSMAATNKPFDTHGALHFLGPVL